MESGKKKNDRETVVLSQDGFIHKPRQRRGAPRFTRVIEIRNLADGPVICCVKRISMPN